MPPPPTEFLPALPPGSLTSSYFISSGIYTWPTRPLGPSLGPFRLVSALLYWLSNILHITPTLGLQHPLLYPLHRWEG